MNGQSCPDNQCFFGAFQAEQLIGIARLSRYLVPNEKHCVCLAGLYVLPPFRRLGCGRLLVEQALKGSNSMPIVTSLSLEIEAQLREKAIQ